MRLLSTRPRRVGVVTLVAATVAASTLPAQAQTHGRATTSLEAGSGAPDVGLVPQRPGPAGVTASGAFLMDTGANRTLWGKGADTRREMASTTKIMTAVVVVTLAGADLGRRITIKQEYRDYVAGYGASTADLRTGDQLSARQLLYALLLPSGCDAAFALADAFGTGGTRAARTQSFIARMNDKAAELGMADTRFDSFDGIQKTGNNYSTPRDLARLARYALANRDIAEMVRAVKTVQKATNGRTYTWYNTNQLLGAYDGVVGVKTGSGTRAGPCLVFAATRGHRTVVGVILNGKERYLDATRMLDWAFEQKSPSLVQLRSLPPGAERD